MDNIMTGFVAGGVIGTPVMPYDSKAKKKSADNKKVERKEGSQV